MSQLLLDWDGRGVLERARDQLLDDLRQVVDVVGLKQVAFDLDQKRSKLSNALAGRDGYYMRMRDLPYFVARSPGHQIVEHLAELRGLRVEMAPPPSPEEELRALRQVLSDELGPGILAALLKKAQGRVR